MDTESLLDEGAFWEIVDRAREAAGGDPDAQAELLVDRLAGLDPQAVTDFARHFESRFNRAYRWDVWGAAWVLLGGAGDDTFENFRCWLIGQGRAVFEGTLHDPDALADLLPADFDARTDGEAEELGYAAYEAYEILTGDQLPALGLPEPPPEPEGAAPDFENDAALAAAWPRLWARFRASDAPVGLAEP
ncbi:DUF4240 domain-containing protein [Streptomyces litchfieldiae]|uniref:DUF4240 domain-containing protein n=1 Tax=Streptomyces litchfieldiae TaxID=3075543 RepID=A0ABU2MSN3_9ACTN|nr:DUF4240 domain-containing protein [Streptomyces sp. DSM 44938]MDT0344647.1 DUF4240 domain-containing protein [Streptomyces sp. DSM 44938]